MARQPNVFTLPLYDAATRESWPRLYSHFTVLYPVSPTLRKDFRIAALVHSPWLTVRAAEEEMLREYKLDAARYLARVNKRIEESEKQ